MVYQLKIKLFIICFIIAGSIIALSVKSLAAAPAITSISGTISHGSMITIQGNGFGANGPTVELYDDFSNGTTGNNISLNGPAVGSWTSFGTYPPTYDTNAHSDIHGAKIFNGSNMQQFQKVFTAPVTEIFFSFWVRVPDGTTFP